MEISIREEFDGPLVGCSIDREAGVIHNALLVGPLSRDGVAYPEATREAAVSLVKGAKVNLSHTRGEGKKYGPYVPPPPTSHERRLGKVIDCRNAPDGLRGDVKCLKAHPFYATLMESAESMPDLFGFSIMASGVIGDEKDAAGHQVCTRISRVTSVDVVTDAATTRGLFEEKDEEPEREATSEEHYDESCRKFATEIIGKFLAGDLSADEAGAKITEHLAAYSTMHGKGKPAEGAEGAEEKKTEEQLLHLKAENAKSKSLVEDLTLQLAELKRVAAVRTPKPTNGRSAGRDPLQILTGDYR